MLECSCEAETQSGDVSAGDLCFLPGEVINGLQVWNRTPEKEVGCYHRVVVTDTVCLVKSRLKTYT